ncbi:MAG: hypothetical protein KAG95_04295 [Bacteroidales bacterium]|nr:hypothetical protein [Bacteroidales bacterium]
MNNIKTKLILITIVLLTIIGCDKKTNNTSLKVDTYPINVGTEWIYNRQVIINKYESETSQEIIDRDTINFTRKVWIEKDTILDDTMNVKVFKFQEDDNEWSRKEYKYIDNEGLKTYAYNINGNANCFAEKSSEQLKKSIVNFYQQNNLKTSHLVKDEIITEDKPTLDIKFPLSNNSSWIYRHPSETRTLQIDKEVIGTESLNLIGQNFSCLKVRWIYLYNSAFNGIEITDWISDKGLIKSLIKNARITLITQNGEPIDGNFQMIETLILKELKIISE